MIPTGSNYDKELLRRYYLKNGFADVKVISADAELAPDGESFYITFTIEEGPLYKVGRRRREPGRYQSRSREALQRAVRDRGPARIMTPPKVDKTVENMTIEAGRPGYRLRQGRARHRARRGPNRTLNITYNIQEGPRTYIERIDIVGNTRTVDEVIRRELRLFEGDAYNRVLVDRARRRLTALDFFEKIDFREEPGSAPDKVVLIVEVVEKSTGSLNFSAGYSTTEGVIGGIGITERNFSAAARHVRLNTTLSFDRQSVDFGFTEPYFMGMPIAAGFDLFATRSDDTEDVVIRQHAGRRRAARRLPARRVCQSLSFKYWPELGARSTASTRTEASPAIIAIRRHHLEIDGRQPPIPMTISTTGSSDQGLPRPIDSRDRRTRRRRVLWQRSKAIGLVLHPDLTKGGAEARGQCRPYRSRWNGDEVPIRTATSRAATVSAALRASASAPRSEHNDGRQGRHRRPNLSPSAPSK